MHNSKVVRFSLYCLHYPWRLICVPHSTSSTLCASFHEGFQDLEQHFEPKLSPDDVKTELIKNEFHQTVPSHPMVKCFSANQIGVNRPVEDRWNAGQFGGLDYTGGKAPTHPSFCYSSSDCSLNDQIISSGLLFNVTDGHAGPGCAHAVNWRYLDYLSACLMTPLQLELVHAWWRRHHCSSTDDYYGTPLFSQELHLCRSFPMHLGHKPWGDMDPTLRLTHAKHIRQFVNELLSSECEDKEEGFYPSLLSSAISSALMRMELDSFSSAMPTSSQTLSKAHLRAVTSGCVTTIAYINNSNECNGNSTDTTSQLYVAQVGDTGAVLASLDESKGSKCWTGDTLIAPHNVDHPKEVERILKEHPLNEADTIFREGRLLGELIPLRAFGDVRFKWKAPELKFVSSVLGLPPNYPITPNFYYTPPYLTCQPEMRHITLDKNRHRFLIIASDGLWDQMTPQEAIDVVAHWLDKHHDYVHSQGHSQQLEKGDTPATVLIRAALGGPSGDVRRISTMLSIPANIARYYRDDITVLVVLFHPK